MHAGIFDGAAQKAGPPGKHTIIEAHPDVLAFIAIGGGTVKLSICPQNHFTFDKNGERLSANSGAVNAHG